MRETEAKLSANTYFLVETIPETIIDNSKEATEVVSEEKGDMVSMVAVDNIDGLLFEGSLLQCFLSFLSTTNYKTIPANLTVLSPPSYRQRRREDVLYFPGSALVLKPKMDAIQSKFIKNETQKYVQH